MVQTIPPRVLLTRPRLASERFAEQLKVSCLVSPLMETVWLKPDPLIDPPDAAVFTSENGVIGFVKSQTWRGLAFCVGDRTAQVAHEAGFEARSARGDLECLKRKLVNEAKDMKLVHSCGVHVIGNLGPLASQLITYEQRAIALTSEAHKALFESNRVIVPLFSPRSAFLFTQELPKAATAPLVVIAMSEAVAQVCDAAGLRVSCVAEKPDGPSMLKAVESALS